MNAQLLIVEDDVALRRMLSWDLEDLGYKVTAAGTCQDARLALKDRRYDLALLDFQLPDGNGLELLKELHQHFPKTRVIVSSGTSTEGLATRALSDGAIGFLPKPVRAPLLHQVFQRALSTLTALRF